MIPTKFQSYVQNKVKEGKSLLLVAPTGIGKTFAVTGDLQESFRKMIYAVPLRALGGDIKKAILDLKREDKPINAVIHHGDLQESMLFSEEVVVTTYDQVVCGVPGLPLSLPLKAGHAVAGAFLMSRLILDEVHLAWGISDQALSILLAIIDFRNRLGLQTIVLTATLPENIAKLICDHLQLDSPIIVGQGEVAEDEGLKLRDTNRSVKISLLELKNESRNETKKLDFTSLDSYLAKSNIKRIYFANTVERIQTTYDRLIDSGMDPGKMIVLHNRMPRSWRNNAERQVRELFGKDSMNGDWLLLTNQVAEAGLDISAPVVISDPAPVDTLVQRAGRCARWFRQEKIEGQFFVIKVPNTQLKDWIAPYREQYVNAAIKSLPNDQDLTWKVEQDWINLAWGGEPTKAEQSVERSLEETTFALNLFDRAAQQRSPGEIANVFREILSVEVAVYTPPFDTELQRKLENKQYPETSSVSIGRGWNLIREAKGQAKIIRYEEGEANIRAADYIQTGDILIIPSTIAFLHQIKGLCFGDGTKVKDAVLSSEWRQSPDSDEPRTHEGNRYQTLLDHATAVMKGTYTRLTSDGAYRKALFNIMQALEPQKNTDGLTNAVAQIAALAASFHDIGKSDEQWQAMARKIDPSCPAGLIGRTTKQAVNIRLPPHTPPGFNASMRACELMGLPSSARYLVAAIALSSVRHHSSLLNPATVDYEFNPSPLAMDFVINILQELDEVPDVRERAIDILNEARKKSHADSIPLLLPNDDLFPIYALIGRAILMADREDAAGKELEQWKMKS